MNEGWWVILRGPLLMVAVVVGGMFAAAPVAWLLGMWYRWWMP